MKNLIALVLITLVYDPIYTEYLLSACYRDLADYQSRVLMLENQIEPSEPSEDAEAEVIVIDIKPTSMWDGVEVIVDPYK